jgi:hypothetical protein
MLGNGFQQRGTFWITLFVSCLADAAVAALEGAGAPTSAENISVVAVWSGSAGDEDDGAGAPEEPEALDADPKADSDGHAEDATTAETEGSAGAGVCTLGTSLTAKDFTDLQFMMSAKDFAQPFRIDIQVRPNKIILHCGHLNSRAAGTALNLLVEIFGPFDLPTYERNQSPQSKQYDLPASGSHREVPDIRAPPGFAGRWKKGGTAYG